MDETASSQHKAHQARSLGEYREPEAMQHSESSATPINRVREMRENRLMTQAQLARKAKVALRTIHSVEKGLNCRMDTKRKILLALGLRFEDRHQVFPSLIQPLSQPTHDETRFSY